MQVWRFSGADGRGALTNDEQGAKLPADLGPWRRASTLTLLHEQADEREAMCLIAEHGFCCFNEHADE